MKAIKGANGSFTWYNVINTFIGSIRISAQKKAPRMPASTQDPKIYEWVGINPSPYEPSIW